MISELCKAVFLQVKNVRTYTQMTIQKNRRHACFFGEIDENEKYDKKLSNFTCYFSKELVKYRTWCSFLGKREACILLCG